MFSGIIEGHAEVAALSASPAGARLSLRVPLNYSDTIIGESICVDGVCLTVVAKGDLLLEFDLASETLRRTSLGDLVAGQKVNVERSLKLGDRICGHLVFGHVDGLATLCARECEGDTQKLSFSCAGALLNLLVPKGSISLAGVSLTIGEVWKEGFSVYLISHSASITTLGQLEVGAKVNLEIDMLARYVASFVSGLGDVRRAA